MGVDDDASCVEHLWTLAEVQLTETGASTVSTCERCGAVAYEPSAVDDPRRPPLR